MAASDKVLLINPNRYRHPPVAPIGLEYLAHALQKAGADTNVLDLTFSEDPCAEITDALKGYKPDVVGVTVRNVDSVLYPDTEFFLPEIKGFIETVRGGTGAPVIVGGAGVSANPEGIRAYLGADAIVVGPGEGVLPELIKNPGAIKGTSPAVKGSGRVIKGAVPAGKGMRPRRGECVDYAPYIKEEGVAGFVTHSGCSWGCTYCIESRTDISFREPSDVLFELRTLKDRGIDHLHLCDPEFNEDLEHSIKFLKELKSHGPGIRWALYMRPGNYSEELFGLLAETGAYLVTLSVDTFLRPEAYWRDVKEMVRLLQTAGVRVAVDLITGFPGEDGDTVSKALEFFRAAGPRVPDGPGGVGAPGGVVINTYLRLYKGLALTGLAVSSKSHKRYLIGEDSSYLSPVFYNSITVAELEWLIGGDGLFRVAGAERAVNYQFDARMKQP